MGFCSRCGISIEGRFCSACGYDNQSQSETKGVDDTVNQLYALRAGLSSVSVQADTIRTTDNQGKNEVERQTSAIDRTNKKIRDNSNKIQEYRVLIAENESNLSNDTLNKLEKELKEKELQEEQERLKIKADVKREKRKRQIALAAAGILIAVGVVSIIVLVVLFGRYLFARKDIEEALGFTLLAFGIGGPTIGYFLCDGYSNKVREPSFKGGTTGQIKEKIKRAKHISSNYLSYREQVPALENINTQLLSENETNSKRLKEYKKEHSEKIDFYTICASETYDALVKEHGSLLDVRDWKNLDLVIYYLETKRAISVREALQLVDRQQQTEAVIDALNMATKQISETINIGFAGMENTVLKCASVLSSQLSDVSVRLSSMELNQDLTNRYLKNISSELAISNSLRKKANVTSAQLMEDVKQIRVYADNAQIRARNS